MLKKYAGYKNYNFHCDTLGKRVLGVAFEGDSLAECVESAMLDTALDAEHVPLSATNAEKQVEIIADITRLVQLQADEDAGQLPD